MSPFPWAQLRTWIALGNAVQGAAAGSHRGSARPAGSACCALRLVVVVQTASLLAPEQLVGPVEAHAQPAAAGDVSQGLGHVLSAALSAHPSAELREHQVAALFGDVLVEGHAHSRVSSAAAFLAQTSSIRSFPSAAPAIKAAVATLFRALAQRRRGRAGHPALGGLVESPPPAWCLWRYPTLGVRSQLLSWAGGGQPAGVNANRLSLY